MYPLVLSTTFLTNIGVITMERRLKGTASQILSQIFEDYKGITYFVLIYMGIFAAIIFMDYLVNHGQISILKAWNSKSFIQKEFEFILSELEEAIITKDTVNNEISYSNK